MKYEKSAGAIVFRELKGDPSASAKLREGELKREYLLLAYPRLEDKTKIIWGFPKGQVTVDEAEAETARREIFEETGLGEFSLIAGFKEKENYLFRRDGDYVRKTAVYFLAQAGPAEAVKLSFEHVGFEWLNFKDALARLSFKGAKEILKKGEGFLNGQVEVPQASLGL